MPKRATPDGEGKRVPLMARTTIGLRKALEDAAAASGRSLAQEVETRLENSFQADNLLNAFIGPDTTSHNAMRAFACMFKYTPEITGKRWVEDYETLWLLRHGLKTMMFDVLGADAGLPEKPQDRSEEDHQRRLREGERLAIQVLRDLGLTLPTRTAGLRDMMVKFRDESRLAQQKISEPSNPGDTK
ncbi:hypothetical protein Q8W71_29790 [Methylobacterium sp. NEAU 140]|uniref:hypothetical protein n=1 Tax=Methylobacterium sp. NEAU 140 TaxID=3064945 RepID=UPI002733DE61|nr:hypothetical protein [Methylobacterium sp. NEAU 140]MDP4026801.1 hypothetical protein [Methylobacterium sp. NEAU 140]